MKISPFVQAIKDGKRVKAGAFWLTTHRMVAPSAETLPEQYTARLDEIIQKLATLEQAKPTPPGQSVMVDVGGKAGQVPTYKWIGKNDQDKREVILGVRLDDRHHLSVEIGEQVRGYFHKDNRVYRHTVKPELASVFEEILLRTPSKFIGQETLRPCSGVLDDQHFKTKKLIMGLDESGRGTLAGPLIAAAVFLEEGQEMPVVYDSKDLDLATRSDICEKIKASGMAYAVVEVDAATIDRIGITAANALAFEQAIQQCEAKTGRKADVILIDGGKLAVKAGSPVEFVTKGESVSKAIAAASILATASHDQAMILLHEKYPDWGFDKNKGYAQQDHLQVLNRQGYCAEHRKSFNPIKTMVEKDAEIKQDQNQLKLV